MFGSEADSIKTFAPLDALPNRGLERQRATAIDGSVLRAKELTLREPHQWR
jgi:hypothetical protein